MNIGNFKSNKDYQDQMERYKEILKLQIKNANREAELNRAAWNSNGEFKPQPIQSTQYKSVEEEQSDRSLQLQNAQNALNMIFKYPADSKKTFDLIMADYDPVEFNKYLPEFLTEIKNAKDITPSLFFNQWERFITIMRSRGDNFVKIGPNDDKAKILLEQQRSGIEKFIKENIDPNIPSLVKNRILYLLKDAVNTSDEKKVLEEGKKMLDASKVFPSESDISSAEDELRTIWLNENEDRYAEMGISRRDIKIPQNVQNRIIQEANQIVTENRNKNLVERFILRLQGKARTTEEEEKGEEPVSLIPTPEKVAQLRERLQQRFEEKQATRERIAEFVGAFGELTKELSAERKSQKEKYEQGQKGLKIMNELQDIARQNRFNYNPQEGIINLKKKNINQQADLSIKFLEKLYPYAPEKRDEIQNMISSLEERPTRNMIKNILVDLPKELAKAYKKLPKGEFKFKVPERLQILKEPEEEGLFKPSIRRQPEEEESLFKPRIPRISKPQILEAPEEKEELKIESEIPRLSAPGGFTLEEQSKLKEIGLLKTKGGLSSDKIKITKAWKKLTNKTEQDIKNIQVQNNFNSNQLKEYLQNDILEKLQIRKRGGSIKGGFIPMLLASTLLPALLGSGQKTAQKAAQKAPKATSKKLSKKIKIISV